MKERIYKLCLNNKFNILLFMSIIICFTISFSDMRCKIVNNETASQHSLLLNLLFIGISIILTAIIIFVIKKIKNKDFDKKIPKIFLITSIILGSVYMFLSPMFSGSDEHNHYYRIYEITEGVMRTPTSDTVGSNLPESLSQAFIDAGNDNINIKYNSILKMLKIKLNKNERIQYGYTWNRQYNNTALYSPIQYAPHAIGFFIGKIFDFGPLTIGMLGRLFNLIAYIILGYLCLKIIPKSKLFYLLILLSPNMLQCATTLSADSFTNVIFLLFVALVLKFSYENKKITTLNEVVLFILSAVISLCKIVYLPAVFLILLIGREKFGNKKYNKLIYCTITIVFTVLISLLWIRSTNGVFNIAYDQSELQKHFILTNPFGYIIIFLRTIAIYIVKYIECLFVGTTMYHSQLQMPAIISFSYVAIVVLSLLKDNNKNKYSLVQKSLVGFIALAITGLAVTAIYVQCTAQFYKVANPTIEGVQGRYFIPVIMLIPLIFKIKEFKINSYKLYKALLTINLITWFYMLSRFML